jgi:hypothetical protein
MVLLYLAHEHDTPVKIYCWMKAIHCDMCLCEFCSHNWMQNIKNSVCSASKPSTSYSTLLKHHIWEIHWVILNNFIAALQMSVGSIHSLEFNKMCACCTNFSKHMKWSRCISIHDGYAYLLLALWRRSLSEGFSPYLKENTLHHYSDQFINVV